LAVQRLISSSIVMLMSVISTHYDLSRISVGHYKAFKPSPLVLSFQNCNLESPAFAFELSNHSLWLSALTFQVFSLESLAFRF
jgi:hypothetical protein